MNSAFINRVKKGAASEVFANIARLVIQIGGVPLFLTFWGTARYGEWLLLTAVLGYLRLSSVGFGQATRNRMAMEVSAGNRDKALGYFQSTSMLFMLIGALLLTVLLLVTMAGETIRTFLNIQTLSADELRLSLLVLGAYILIHLQVEVLDAGFRCEGHYGLSTFLVVLTEIAIFAMIVVVMVTGGGLVAGTFCYLAGGVLRFAILYLVLKRYADWIDFGFSEARWQTVRDFAWPSLAFMAFPLGNAMVLQGVLIVIGAILGPGAVVIYNTMRMMTRYTVHLTVMFSRIANPEIAYAYGRGDSSLVRRIHWQVCRLGFWAALGACAVLALLLPWVLDIWTQGRIEAVAAVYLPLLLAVLFWAMHTLCAIVLQATNNHRQFALVFVAVGTLSVIPAIFLTKAFGLPGAAFATLLSELALLVYVLPRSAWFSGGTAAMFLRHAAKPPSLTMMRHLKAKAAG